MKNLNADTKKMIKTFGVFVGVMVIILIVLFIFIAIAGSKVSDAQLINVVENAAKRYYVSHESELPSNEGESVKVTTETLIANKYMKSFDKITKNTGCSGEVKVTNNNGSYLYTPTIKCSEFKTTTIAETIESTLTNSGDGLYLADNTYYYRGEYVNNYIRLGEKNYRIVSIKDGIIKVVDPKLDDMTYVWDDRYNIERSEDGLGINDYSKSRLRETIGSFYEKIDENVRKYIIKTDWCVGKRSSSDSSIVSNECSDTVSDYLGTITASEYVRISIDENCNSLYSGSCKNYNYFYNTFTKNIWTLTAVSDNSYTSLYIANGVIESRKTFSNYKFALSFNINGNNTYVSGSGTESDPYIIR